VHIFNHHSIPLLAETDILVIGAGSAGCVAALAAAQHHNYKVMLIERYGFPGGTSTQMLDTFYGFFSPGTQSKKIVGGIPDDVVNELEKTNDIFLRPNTYGAGTGVNYNPERLKLVWDKLITETGVDYLLHTTLVDVVNDGNEKTTCICWNKSGFYKIKAKRVIDASGDADYCYLSGCEFELAGEKEPAQSMTTTFRMCNVDQEKFEKAGFVFSGTSPDGKLVEVIELKDHPFFIASQFHPEFLSKPHQPHPLFKGFIAAAHQYIHHKPL